MLCMCVIVQMHEKDAVQSHEGEHRPPKEKKVVPYSVVHVSKPAGEFLSQ